MLIQQDNLTVRNATAADAPQLGIWWRDGKVMAHAGFPNGLSITDEEIAKDLEQDSDDTCRRLIIELNSVPIGEMSYRNKGDNTAEIGIKICDFAAQEKGHGSRLLRMLIDTLFRDYGYQKIILDTNLNNKRAQHVYEKLGFQKVGVRRNAWKNQLGEPQSAVDYVLYKKICDIQILSLRKHPEYAGECRKLLLHHFNEFTSKHPAEILASADPFPQGYFMRKAGRVIGWTGLYKKEAVSGRVYGWEGSIKKEEVQCDDLSPWITPLLVHPEERGRRYGKLLLDHARKEAGKLGFQYVYLTTGEIGYYEKYGFREVGLTTFTWGRPTKVYEHTTT